MGFCGVLWRNGNGGRLIEPKFVAAGLRAVKLPGVWEESKVEEAIEFVCEFVCIFGVMACPGGLKPMSESLGGVGRVC